MLWHQKLKKASKSKVSLEPSLPLLPTQLIRAKQARLDWSVFFLLANDWKTWRWFVVIWPFCSIIVTLFLRLPFSFGIESAHSPDFSYFYFTFPEKSQNYQNFISRCIFESESRNLFQRPTLSCSGLLKMKIENARKVFALTAKDYLRQFYPTSVWPPY